MNGVTCAVCGASEWDGEVAHDAAAHEAKGRADALAEVADGLTAWADLYTGIQDDPDEDYGVARVLFEVATAVRAGHLKPEVC